MSWRLDTDVMCQPIKTHGHAGVVRWLLQEHKQCYTSTVVIAQIAYWICSKEGMQRERLQTWFRRSMDAMEGRILSFNTSVAHLWADQKWQLEAIGQQMPIEDGYIAATARKHGLTVATGNDKDFRRPGIKVFNPFKELPPLHGD